MSVLQRATRRAWAGVCAYEPYVLEAPCSGSFGAALLWRRPRPREHEFCRAAGQDVLLLRPRRRPSRQHVGSQPPRVHSTPGRRSRSCRRWLDEAVGEAGLLPGHILQRLKARCDSHARRGEGETPRAPRRHLPGCGNVRVLQGREVLKEVSLDKAVQHTIIPIGSFASVHSGIVKVKVMRSGKAVVIDGLGASRA
jgi:hypothetical protein